MRRSVRRKPGQLGLITATRLHLIRLADDAAAGATIASSLRRLGDRLLAPRGRPEPAVSAGCPWERLALDCGKLYRRSMRCSGRCGAARRRGEHRGGKGGDRTEAGTISNLVWSWHGELGRTATRGNHWVASAQSGWRGGELLLVGNWGGVSTGGGARTAVGATGAARRRDRAGRLRRAAAADAEPWRIGHGFQVTTATVRTGLAQRWRLVGPTATAAIPLAGVSTARRHGGNS